MKGLEYKIKYSFAEKIGLRFFASLDVPKTIKITGIGSSEKLCGYIKKDNISKLLIIVSKSVIRNNLTDKLFEQLDKAGITYLLNTDVSHEPDYDTVENIVNLCITNNCDGIIAIGGGAILDSAKAVGLRVTNPSVSLKKMSSFLTALKPLNNSLPIYAVPTTAGTGSEITIYSVVTDNEANKKTALISDKFIPCVTVLDAKFTETLPMHYTASSGMDALTHSIEAYISKFSEKFPKHKQTARKACKTVYNNISKVCKNPHDFNARQKMLEGSFEAGVAIARNGLGYAHAIGHRIGEFYGIRHGDAVSMILPYVLYASMSDDRVTKLLAELSVECGIGQPKEHEKVLADAFISEIINLNQAFEIPDKIPDFRKDDMPAIIKRVKQEAKFQGVPVRFSDKQLEYIISQVTG